MSISGFSLASRSLVRSSVLHDEQISFKERDDDGSLISYHWFTLSENRLVSIPFPSLPEPCSVALMVGHEIYFVGVYYNLVSRNMWILDTLPGKLRQGPSMRVARYFTAVGLVDGKIYVFGGCKEDEEIQAEVFDTKTQTWEVAPNPNPNSKLMSPIFMSVVIPIPTPSGSV